MEDRDETAALRVARQREPRSERRGSRCSTVALAGQHQARASRDAQEGIREDHPRRKNPECPRQPPRRCLVCSRSTNQAYEQQRTANNSRSWKRGACRTLPWRRQPRHDNIVLSLALATPLMLSTIGSDLNYAMRRLWARPTHAAVVILTLALAIGANTAVFNPRKADSRVEPAHASPCGFHRHAHGTTDDGVSRAGRRNPRGWTAACSLSAAHGFLRQVFLTFCRGGC